MANKLEQKPFNEIQSQYSCEDMAVSPLDSRYTTEMTPVFDEGNKLRKWMEVEVALAKAHAKLGHIPREAPPAIEAGMEKVKLVELF